MKTALTIAGSDPTGGAGLQADLKVFRSFKVHGLSVVSAITAQNTEDVDSVFPVEQDSFRKQLHTILSDIRPDAIKMGMLYSSWAVEIVEEIIKGYSLSNFVIDPVTVSSSGISLVAEGTLDALREKLFPLSKVITPNIYEVVITGGHLKAMALDLYYDGDFHYIKSKKIEGEYHGTGCAFSSAITASLALGNTPLESVRKAKEFIVRAIKKAYHPGKGMGLLFY